MTKVVPEEVMTIKGMSPVVRVISYPPNTHPKDSAIRSELTLVRVFAVNGCHRDYGFERAWIDSHLKMRVSGFNPGFEEVSKWRDGK